MSGAVERQDRKAKAAKELVMDPLHNEDPEEDEGPGGVADDAVDMVAPGFDLDPPKGTGVIDDGVDTEAALDIVNHLLWHKALIDEQDDGSRLDEYIDLVRASEKGEHLTIRNDFDKSMAIAFELVLQEHLNPWKIDLGEFSRMYLVRAKEENVELVTAGRIILMAWTVLKLQSDAMVELAERLAQPPEPEADMDFLDWGDIEDWDGDDEGYEYTRRVTHSPQAPIDEKIRRKGASRKVTLMELVDAFEEVRREAEQRQVTMAERERLRKLWKQQSNDSVSEMMHADDPEEDQKTIWARIASQNGAFIPLTVLHDPGIDEFTTAFTSVLFLAADRRVDLWQHDFPHGPILIKNREAAGLAPEDPPAEPDEALLEILVGVANGTNADDDDAEPSDASRADSKSNPDPSP